MTSERSTPTATRTLLKAAMEYFGKMARKPLHVDNPSPEECASYYSLPTAHPIFPDCTSAPDGTKLCADNCAECLRHNRLCWSIGKGESVGFLAH